ncbi:hypothetical protein APE_1013.1 [Aeropyrum pernix K1]|uniref:Archaeal Type IV pilin N-terminal domain-containing protein n=1 Tax=Aeropyrum pernix (strain ATCC 700893 / DSM 11879 / JCM 9820 / NBRC 100138 / K1) TaxID=272557 RepID=Q9YD99_AERPE|nr:type IV pilin [Aeropyrum pernix]BAA79998.2 hypothetical protein APE_1013.1 [Aeropyrum pernix K1]
MRLRRGISPVIATVIIVAVAIAISIAVAGWLFGLWGSFATGSPQIQVSAAKVVYETINNTDNDEIEAKLYINNSGGSSDTLIRIEISGNNKTCVLDENNLGNVLPFTIQANTTEIVSTGAIILNGTTCSLTEGDIGPGDNILVKLYFEKSGVISVPTVVSEGIAGQANSG